ncbi:DNA damage-inducible protein 1 [Endocarpon pusillum Z07020]|uniref:DNA damage-inducible protein 1 n=1 Tax=Endocarpon pusillum (strain Z07020 / HMAS-L-300199) TaxID=1263415 RepID=U1GGE8_ENDPU|nr:DNA damage-inducible protein 1 [Endocarpon pusillum Z07020]ERF76742.1 DNA damage-inducible protein 1 [Endocarpon pusillum Z07020]
MTFNDIKALVHGDTNIPPASQHFYYNTRVITDNSQTLEQLNIHEGDMLGMAVQDSSGIARRRTQQDASSQQAARPPHPQRDEGRDVERLRLHIVGDPRMLEEVRREDPELANAANNKDQFHALWDRKQRQLAQIQAEKEAELALLNADPFNLEAQAKIEEMIRQERVAENVQKALEDNPESFGRVIMLYIDVVVNNVPIKAFVDSGAQTTIMSPSAAQNCGIMRLIDRRYGGIARGVGTAEILGRVHSAEIQIGSYSLQSSFTVMEGKDVDLLLGLDMLKRHQMCIDLKENALRVQDEKIPFLPENEIPKQLEEHMLEDEPKIEGPGGTKVGARTGTVEQHGQCVVKSGGNGGGGLEERECRVNSQDHKSGLHKGRSYPGIAASGR